MVDTYTSPDMVAAELRATTPFSDSTYPSLSTVQQWIEETGAHIDTLAGFVAAETMHTDFLTYDGQEILAMRYSPIISITSLAENTNSLGADAGEAWVIKTADTHYFLDSDSGQVLVNLLKWQPKPGFRKLRIVYKSGYTTIPATHQMLATKMVTGRVLSSLLGQNIQESNDGGSVSVGTISIVEPASYGVNTYKQLKTDIQELQAQLLGGTTVYRYNC